MLEKSGDGFVLAPEVKFTKVDGRSRTLIGGYGGVLVDNTFFFGAGGYLLAQRYWRHDDQDWNRDHGRDRNNDDWVWDWDANDQSLAYGGFVFGWTAPVAPAVRVGVRGLAGFGRATLTDDVTIQVYPPITASRRHENFFVAEPQAEVVVKLQSWLALTASGGYRAILTTHDRGDFDRRLRGGVASFSVRFGPF